ncbi:MAG: MFS transporter, partial [Planctomycetota bacterium]
MLDDRSSASPYAAFAIPAYRAYLSGSVLMQIGTAGQALAIGFEVYTRTEEALSLGWVALMQALPMLLLTLPAGVLADRVDRRKIMLFGLTGATLTSIGLGLLSYFEGPIGWMYFLLFMDSVFIRTAWPARAALLPMIVPRDMFENAVKWRSSSGQLASLIGPAVGGFVLAWSIPATYFLAACTSTTFFILLTRLRVDTRPPAMANPKGLAGVITDLREGLGFVWRRKILLGTISLDLFAVLLGGAVYLLPIYATDILGVGERGLGLLGAAPAAGALCMAVTLAYLPPLRRAGPTMLLAVAGFGVATIVFGLSTNFFLSLAMLFLTGVFDNISVVVRHTLVQLATPDHMRGRVSAVSAV